jgi:hypothetical protein
VKTNLSPLPTAELQAQKAREGAEPFISAAKGAKQVQENAKAALLSARKAVKESAVPSFNLTKSGEIAEAVRDCLERSKDDCAKRDSHCVWRDDAIGCAFKCDAVKSADTCQIAGQGFLCKWDGADNQKSCKNQEQ